MPQFFINSDDIKDGIIKLSGSDLRHLVKVRRAAAGDKIYLRGSDGRGYEARIIEIDDYSLAAAVEKEFEEDSGNVSLRVFLSLLKGSNFEFSLQKCVEAGAAEITPLLSERTVPDIKNKVEQKLERWRKIASESAKQCLRKNIPLVNAPVEFKTAVIEPGSEERIVAHPGAEVQLKDYLRSRVLPVSADLAIGPEGGFSPEEIKLAERYGWSIINSGSSHLRAETAAIIIPAIILYEWS